MGYIMPNFQIYFTFSHFFTIERIIKGYAREDFSQAAYSLEALVISVAMISGVS